jgi:hypothetical protein
MRSLGILLAASALALACGRAEQTDAAAEGAQTYDEAADELAADVAAGVSSAEDEARKAAE